MATQPVVTIFGATGNQGGGVANQLLSSGKYAVRAVTRNTTKPAAQKLAAAGAELVTADLNDEAALEQALQGAWAVFAVTNFWDPTNTGQETVQGERLAKVAKAAGVKVFLWSSLPNAAQVSGGKWEVAHFSDKAKAEPSILEQGFEYVAFLEPPYYFENMKGMFTKENEAGEVEFSLALSPDTKLVGGDPSDVMGKGALAALEDASGARRFDKQHIALCGYNEPVSKWLSDFEAATGRKAKLNVVPLEELMKMNEELGQMFGWFQEHGYYGDTDVASGERLCGEGAFLDWPAWLKKSGWTGGK